jgi:hypothetical protein
VPNGDVETYFEDGLWKNRIEGSPHAANTHETRSAAVHAGRQMADARRTEHVIRDAHGSTAQRNTYRDDVTRSAADDPRPGRTEK